MDFAERFLAGAPNLEVTPDDLLNRHGSGAGPMSPCEAVIGRIEERDRHMARAGLLRELIDGRIGQ